MKLNCRPNQLAMLIRDIKATHGFETKVACRSGMIIKTTKLIYFEGLPSWEFEDPFFVTLQYSCGCKFTLELKSLNDEVLRPLPELPDEEEELRLTDLKEPA